MSDTHRSAAHTRAARYHAEACAHLEYARGLQERAAEHMRAAEDLQQSARRLLVEDRRASIQVAA